MFFFVFKQKTAYEMRISDWSSDVCSSDLGLADAMIVIGTTSNRAAWDYFAQAQASGLDFVCWGSPGSPFHWMRSENDIGGQLAAEHFIATGRRHIAFVGPQQSPQRQFDERRDG